MWGLREDCSWNSSWWGRPAKSGTGTALGSAIECEIVVLWGTEPVSRFLRAGGVGGSVDCHGLGEGGRWPFSYWGFDPFVCGGAGAEEGAGAFGGGVGVLGWG